MKVRFIKRTHTIDIIPHIVIIVYEHLICIRMRWIIWSMSFEFDRKEGV